MARVLIVDDSAFSRKIIRRALGEEHEYLEAADGMEGLEKYALHHQDVVILDLTMPGLHGIEVIRRLKGLDPKAKIIVGTADIQKLSVQEALEAGADRVVPKPFSIEALQEALQDVLKI